MDFAHVSPWTWCFLSVGRFVHAATTRSRNDQRRLRNSKGMPACAPVAGLIRGVDAAESEQVLPSCTTVVFSFDWDVRGSHQRCWMHATHRSVRSGDMEMLVAYRRNGTLFASGSSQTKTLLTRQRSANVDRQTLELGFATARVLQSFYRL